MTNANNLLPYRPNVGAMIFDPQGRIFLARRTDMPGAGQPGNAGIWQCPQGGIDEGENPEQAVLREVAEEIGTSHVTILASYPDWLSYDLPPHLIGKALGGKYRGQTQKWFALRFTGSDSDIRLDVHQPAEFDTWRWVNAEDIPLQNTGFKAATYATLLKAFSQFATP